MERNEVVETVKVVISEETGISAEEMKETDQLMMDLELSSLEVLAVVGELERKLMVHVDVNELNQVATLGNLVDCFFALLKGKA